MSDLDNHCYWCGLEVADGTAGLPFRGHRKHGSSDECVAACRAEIERQSKRIAELEGALSQAEFYRDAAHAEHKQTREALDAAYSVHQCRMESCGRDVERLEMRVAELEAALAPFAEQDGLLARQRYFTSIMFRDAAKAMEGQDDE